MADFALNQLRALLAPTARTAGVVTRRRGALVEVATADGLVLATPGAALQVGQAVALFNGVAWPQATAGKRYAV